jgi:probable rRNA maturation factor
MLEVVNRQRRRPIDVRCWQAFAEEVLQAIGKEGHSVTIAFVSDPRIRELNRTFRDQDRATDVLSFPTDTESELNNDALNLGDIAISVDRALDQARENDLTFDNEVEQLILHGLLHLSGYDHETDDGEMNRLELRMRKKLGI